MKFEKLEKLITILSGYAFKSSFFNDTGDGLPLIRVRDVNSGFAGIYYSGKYDESFVINNNDILIGLDGDFRCITWTMGKALLNQRVCKIVPDTKLINENYLLHFLPSALNKIHRNTNYTTVKHLSTKSIKDIRIPLPLLKDQIRIAEILTQADSLIKQRKESILLLDELLNSNFLEMFGDPIKNEKKYNSVILEEICNNIFLGLTSKVDYVDEGGYPLIRATDINSGKLSFDNVKYISEKQHKLITKNRITKRGDLLVSKSGSLGTCAIVDSDREFTTYESIITIQPKKEFLNNYYLIYLLRNQNFKIKMLGSKVGGTVGHLNLQMFRNMVINLPPIEFQNKFALIVEKVEFLKKEYEAILRELENLYKVLSQKAFTGELNFSKVSSKIYKEEIKTPITGSVEPQIEVESLPVFPEKKKQFKDIQLDKYYEIPTEIIAKYGSIKGNQQDWEFLLKKFFYNIPVDLSKLEDIYLKLYYQRGDDFEFEDLKEFIFEELSKPKSFIRQKYNSETKQLELVINEVKTS